MRKMTTVSIEAEAEAGAMTLGDLYEAVNTLYSRDDVDADTRVHVFGTGGDVLKVTIQIEEVQTW